MTDQDRFKLASQIEALLPENKKDALVSTTIVAAGVAFKAGVDRNTALKIFDRAFTRFENGVAG